MNERITQFDHAGKTIVYIDYSNLRAPEAAALTRELASADLSDLTELRILINATNSRASPESVAAMKDLISLAGQSDTSTALVKSAVFGLGTLGQIFLDGLRRVAATPMRAFSTHEEALAWLAE
jgi:hypothetical protein